MPVKKKRGGKRPAKRKTSQLIDRKRCISVVDQDQPAASETQSEQAKPIRNLSRHAKRLVARTFAEVMDSVAEKSKNGSLPHARFLFEIGGVKEEIERQGQGKPEPSLAKLLLAEVKRQHAEKVAARVRLALTSGEPKVVPAEEATNEVWIAEQDTDDDGQSN